MVLASGVLILAVGAHQLKHRGVTSFGCWPSPLLFNHLNVSDEPPVEPWPSRGFGGRSLWEEPGVKLTWGSLVPAWGRWCTATGPPAGWWAATGARTEQGPAPLCSRQAADTNTKNRNKHKQTLTLVVMLYNFVSAMLEDTQLTDNRHCWSDAAQRFWVYDELRASGTKRGRRGTIKTKTVFMVVKNRK